MSHLHRSAAANRSAIILAGGDGVRLRDLTRFITGFDTPKQFCAVTGETTLLEETRHRIASLIPIERTAIVVNRNHRRFYEPLVADLPKDGLVEQARNRGTAPAIFIGLRHLSRLGSDATVAIFPSDHFIGDTERFMAHVDSAMAAVEAAPERVVILGIVPRGGGSSYGWIEPLSVKSPLRPGLFPVSRFWEKPRPELAASLWRKGCLWNSFVTVGRTDRLEEIMVDCLPRMKAAFEATMASKSGNDIEGAIEQFYERLPVMDFSEEILARMPSSLMVQRVDDVEWDDLGEPDRVLHALRTIGHEPGWVKPFLFEGAYTGYPAQLRHRAPGASRI